MNLSSWGMLDWEKRIPSRQLNGVKPVWVVKNSNWSGLVIGFSNERKHFLDVSLGCAESNLLRFFPLQKRDPFPPLSKMMNIKSVGLQVLWILWLPIGLPSLVSPVLPVGRDVPRDGRLLSPCRWGIRSRVVAMLRLARPLGTFGRQGVWQRTRFPLLHRAFSSVAGVGGPKLTWLRQKASSLKARLARRPSRSRPYSPRSCDMLCFPSLFPSKGWVPCFCGSRSHALIPTGARSRPAALPKPIIISVPRPHCWKGSASKPYVELPPHTAPLGMEVGPAQACAVKVFVHDLIKKEWNKKKKRDILFRARKTFHFIPASCSKKEMKNGNETK